MRILHVVNISFVIPYFLGKQLSWFAEKGYGEYIICSPSDELAVFSKRYGFYYKPVDILRKISILNDLKAIFETYKYIKEIKADIVTGHTPKGGVIAMIAAWAARVPVRIYFRHGLVYETSTGLRRSLLVNTDRLASRLATKIICVSPSVAQRSIEDGLNPENKQTVLAKGTCNGIDTERFNNNVVNNEKVQELRLALGINYGDFVIGFAGRLVRDKGIIELVRAYQEVRKAHQNVRLMLVGMLEKRDILPEDVIKTIKEDKGIICTGYVGYATIEQYYSLMDVYVLPSYREGFRTSVLEASSMEIPVITSRATGCCDSILEGKSGYFVNHDENELELVLLKLINDKSLRKSMGEAGRKYVEDNFRQEIVWKEIEKLYQR